MWVVMKVVLTELMMVDPMDALMVLRMVDQRVFSKAVKKALMMGLTTVAMRVALRVVPMVAKRAAMRVAMRVAMWVKVGDFHTMLSCRHPMKPIARLYRHRHLHLWRTQILHHQHSWISHAL